MEAVRREVPITKNEIPRVLKIVGTDQTFPYEVYVRLSPKLVLLLATVYNSC